MTKNKQITTRTMVLTAVMTAVVAVLQLLGSFIRFGPFSISLVLVPIVIGAAVCGYWSGAWLGLSFGVVVLLSGDAAAFYAINPLGTVVTVLVKGVLAGFAAGLVYKLLYALTSRLESSRKEAKQKWFDKLISGVLKYLPVIGAAVICPVVNTGVFLIGCRLFFYDTIVEWGRAVGYANAGAYMFLGLAGGNFLFELLTNVLLSPGIVKLLSLNKKIFKF